MFPRLTAALSAPYGAEQEPTTEYYTVSETVYYTVNEDEEDSVRKSSTAPMYTHSDSQGSRRTSSSAPQLPFIIPHPHRSSFQPPSTLLTSATKVYESASSYTLASLSFSPSGPFNTPNPSLIFSPSSAGLPSSSTPTTPSIPSNAARKQPMTAGAAGGVAGGVCVSFLLFVILSKWRAYKCDQGKLERIRARRSGEVLPITSPWVSMGQ